MKYVALLRGINVGGNNIIKMIQLKKCFERCGFTNVLTYIQSGNVIFESPEGNKEQLTKEIEILLSKKFDYEARIVLRNYVELKKVVENVPEDWNKRTDIRCYIAFIKEPLTADKALKDIDIQEGIDSIKVYTGVLYMTSLLNALTKSSFNKLATKKIYKDMTIRNYNTTKRILALME